MDQGVKVRARLLVIDNKLIIEIIIIIKGIYTALMREGIDSVGLMTYLSEYFNIILLY